MSDFDPIEHVDEVVTVRGTARNARAGAIVQLDDRTPIYVAGLTAWDAGYRDKQVEATGLLRKRPPRVPKTPPGGLQSHGLTDETFVLEEASWSVVE